MTDNESIGKSQTVDLLHQDDNCCIPIGGTMRVFWNYARPHDLAKWRELLHEEYEPSMVVRYEAVIDKVLAEFDRHPECKTIGELKAALRN